MDHFNCNNCGAPINWWDKYVKEICNDEKWYDGMQALAEGHQPIPPTEIEYYKCKQCGKEFTPKEAKDIENQRLQTRASQLNCSIEIVKIIENLQKRIKDLEKINWINLNQIVGEKMYKNRKMGVEFFNKLISDPYRIMKEEVEVKPKKPWYGFIGFVKFCKLIFTQLYKLFAKCSVKVTNLIVCLFKHPFGVLKFLAKNLLFLTMVVFLLFVLIIQLFREYGGEPEDSMTYCSKVLKNTLGSRFEFISVVSGLYCAVTFIYVIYCLLCLI